MKNIFSWFVLCILLVQFRLDAQVRETKMAMSLGVQNGLSIYMNNAEEKLLDKVWKKYVKDYGKLERNKKAQEEYLRGAVIKTINGSGPLDVYIITENNQATVFFDLGTGFINSQGQSEAYKAAEEFVQEFAYEVEREQLRIKLEEEQDKLKKLNKKMGNLVEDNKDYHKDIEEALERIKKREGEIKENEKEQANAKIEIETQSRKVTEMQTQLSLIGKKK